MPFPDAVRTCLEKYAVFSGRAGRPEYWWFALFTVLVDIAAKIVDSVLGTTFPYQGGLVTGLASLALVLPSLAVTWRRMHDTSRSGWWVLIVLVPCIGWLVLLVFLLLPSHPDNKYGPARVTGVQGAS